MASLGGFKMMQTPERGASNNVQDLQPQGNLPLMKPDDLQYFNKLLVSPRSSIF